MRELREVVSKDAEKTRQTKSESYDLTDAYEVGLLNYAEDPEHGNYSEFVKRAIAFYRDAKSMPQQHIPVIVRSMENDDEDSVDGFL
ncbi:hypothetical protein [Sporosarcina jiandibaonis]|uniref:hypothetical protein n=1 Tax=Sporosarcina jiandibaonis TaxID=2715535 RepID=UPI00155325F5|nr:hypothetical protein [Sporosarcina jiandibaonis]